DSLSGGRRQSVLERSNVVLVVIHGLLPAATLCFDLGQKTLALIRRVVELGKAVRDFPTCDEQLESIGNFRTGIISSRQGTHRGGEFGDEGRLDEVVFHPALEECGDQLAMRKPIDLRPARDWEI